MVKTALQHNPAAVIFAHNNRSGLCQPSRADELLSNSLKAALALIDVRVLDHCIVTAASAYSFVEHGKLSPARVRKKV